jgi:hypothetical protein
MAAPFKRSDHPVVQGVFYAFALAVVVGVVARVLVMDEQYGALLGALALASLPPFLPFLWRYERTGASLKHMAPLPRLRHLWAALGFLPAILTAAVCAEDGALKALLPSDCPGGSYERGARPPKGLQRTCSIVAVNGRAGDYPPIVEERYWPNGRPAEQILRARGAGLDFWDEPVGLLSRRTWFEDGRLESEEVRDLSALLHTVKKWSSEGKLRVEAAFTRHLHDREVIPAAEWTTFGEDGAPRPRLTDVAVLASIVGPGSAVPVIRRGGRATLTTGSAPRLTFLRPDYSGAEERSCAITEASIHPVAEAWTLLKVAAPCFGGGGRVWLLKKREQLHLVNLDGL